MRLSSDILVIVPRCRLTGSSTSPIFVGTQILIDLRVSIACATSSSPLDLRLCSPPASAPATTRYSHVAATAGGGRGSECRLRHPELSHDSPVAGTTRTIRRTALWPWYSTSTPETVMPQVGGGERQDRVDDELRDVAYTESDATLPCRSVSASSCSNAAAPSVFSPGWCCAALPRLVFHSALHGLAVVATGIVLDARTLSRSLSVCATDVHPGFLALLSRPPRSPPGAPHLHHI
ncbi:hypothetical protein DFH09DRAFT_1329489 [Mycena vulgaris]|nr:hypothetical protein DFH09DRAFT_1329489 [Mycena vulgaris]